MDLYFNGVAAIIDEEYNASLTTADHCGNILCRHLEEEERTVEP